MIPKALSPKEYKEKAYQFIRGDIDQKALLKQWEIQYLEVNENFHFYLADAIDYCILQEYKTVNEILIANPKMKLEEVKKSFSIDRYRAYKNFVYQRGLTLAAKKEPIPTANNKREKKKDRTIKELFLSNEDRLNAFLNLLKRDEIKALDKNNKWIYGKKNTIVACFEALKDKGYIKQNVTKAELQRIVASVINFEGSTQLFRKDYNRDDFDYFFNLFSNHLP